jgi:hypothetical protein
MKFKHRTCTNSVTSHCPMLAEFCITTEKGTLQFKIEAYLWVSTGKPIINILEIYYQNSYVTQCTVVEVKVMHKYGSFL